MITKSKLHEIFQLWKKLDTEKSSSLKVRLVKEVISLPMHSELTHDQIDYITSTVLEFFT